MSVRQYLMLLVKHRYLLLGGLIAGLGLAVFTARSEDLTYRGSVDFFIASAGEDTASAANLGDQFALRRVNSYLSLLETDRLGAMVTADTGLSLSPDEVTDMIEGSADMNTVLLRVRVEDGDRDTALTVAESLSRQLPQLVAEIERPAVGDPTVRLELVSGPAIDTVPVPTTMILLTRVAACLAAALVLLAIRELTDNRLHSIDVAASLSRKPVLGLITSDRKAGKSPLVLEGSVHTPRAEEYRQVRTNLQFIDADHHSRAIVITSSIPGEGKSVTAANLGIAFARAGQRVALVDADLRKPTLGQLFGFDQSVGVVDVLRGQAQLDDVLQPWGPNDLRVLPSGSTTSIPSELLGTVAMERLLVELRSQFDIVIIDTPPLVPVTDAAVVSTFADGVVLLARPDRVTKAQLQRSLANLTAVQANLVGVVGTMLPESTTMGSYYGASTNGASSADNNEAPLRAHSMVDGAGRESKSSRRSTDSPGSMLEEALRTTGKGRGRN